MLNLSVRCATLAAILVLGGFAAQAQSQAQFQAQSAPAKPTTPGEIAAASRLIAEKNEGCRLEANKQKLHLFKRRRFMRDCKRKP